jgi:hypothetical protein
MKKKAPKATKKAKKASRSSAKRKAVPKKTKARAASRRTTRKPARASSNALARKPRKVKIAPKSQRRRPDDADAFLRVKKNGARTKDDLADELGADFLGSATSGEEQALEARDSVTDEEVGGPFVTTPAKREFAREPDASNPEDAEREPFPSAISQPEPRLLEGEV